MLIKRQMVTLWEYLINFFTKGHQRSVQAKKNIIGSFLIKGCSILISLILVPLTIYFLTHE